MATHPDSGDAVRQPTARSLGRTRTPGVYRRGSRYVVRFRGPDGRQRQRSARTLEEARKLKAALVGDVARGEYRELSRVALVDYAEAWAATYTGRTGRGVRPATLADYRRDLERWALPFFGPRRLSEIEPQDVKRFAAHLRDAGLSPARVRNVMAPLRAMLATAVEEGLIRHNPAASLRLPTRNSSDALDHDSEPVRALTPEELSRLLGETPDDWRIFIRFLACTGLRIGEAIALRWGDVDLERGRVRVRRRIYRGGVDAPKSAFGRREIPISRSLSEELAAQRSEAAFAADADAVWATRVGTPHKPENLFRRVLKPAAERAGVGWAGFHTLRHTCASMLFRQGASAKQVQVVLGHHSPAFTLATYVHLLPDDLPDPELLEAVIPPGGVNKGSTRGGKKAQGRALA